MLLKLKSRKDVCGDLQRESVEPGGLLSEAPACSADGGRQPWASFPLLLKSGYEKLEQTVCAEQDGTAARGTQCELSMRLVTQSICARRSLCHQWKGAGSGVSRPLVSYSKHQN